MRRNAKLSLTALYALMLGNARGVADDFQVPPTVAGGFRRRSGHSNRSASKYRPHQGYRECERRRTPGGFAGTGGA